MSINERFLELENKAKTFTEHEKILNVESLDYTSLENFKSDFEPLHSLWISAADWQISMSDNLRSTFTSLNAEKLNSYIYEMNKVVTRVLKLVSHKLGKLVNI